MTQNLGETNLRRKRRVGNPMREFDKLPKPLRRWLAEAILPWSPVSVKRVWHQSMNKGLSFEEILNFLDKTEETKIKMRNQKLKNNK